MYAEIATTIACTAILAFWMFRVCQIVATRIAMDIKALDSSLGQIVERLLGGELEGMEPVNPVQALLASFIQKKIDSIPQDIAVVRPATKGEDGKFKKIEDF